MDKEYTAENSHYDKWFVVQSVDSDHSVSKLLPFILNKAIHSAVGTVKTVRLLRNGHLLLEVASASGNCFRRPESNSEQAGQPGWLPGHSQPSQDSLTPVKE